MHKKIYTLAILVFTSFNLSIGQSSLKFDFASSDVLADHVYQMISFDKPLLNSDHSVLKGLGIELVEHMGRNKFLASFPLDLNVNDLLKLNVSNLGKLEASYKIGSTLRNETLPDWAVVGNKAKLMLHYPSNLNQDYILGLCQHNSIEVVQSNGYNNLLEVEIAINDIQRVITLPFIIGLESISPPARPDDKLGRNLHRVNKINKTTGAIRNYTGEGVTVLVRDDGKVFEHIDFTGRMDNTYCGESRGDHGDGVAGLIAGAGNLDPNNQGMAFGSKMFVIDYRSHFLDETMNLVNNQGVLITNSSYSDGCNDGYTSNTRNVDQQMFENPKLLHVFSAGNDGESDCGYGAGPNWGNITGGHKIGKNVIAVANLNNLNVVESSSSRGPAFDGRIKPDIAANGFGHVSTIESQGYEPFGGTSAAAPVVAGITSMLYDGFRQNHGETPDAALIKAILLNSASDLGNKGPDFIFGWGSINAHRAALTIEEGRFFHSQIVQEQFVSHDIEIPANVKEVKIMTYWPDKNGTTSASQHLIIDINSSLIKDTDQFLPWVLDPTPDPSLLNLPATKGFDNTNNMEQIAIDNPSPGTYQLKLQGNYIPFGAADYYVVWEFTTDEIDITYPNGGENVINRDREVFHWDAVGTEGDFEVNLINSSGDTLINRSIDGQRRFVSLTMPTEYHDDLKLFVSRNGVTDSSGSTFIVSKETLALKASRNETGAIVLSWNGFEEAASYNVYVLGDKYMEIIGSSDSTSFVFPKEKKYEIGWTAVSPVFADGREGKRTIAIPIRPAPLAQVSDNIGGRPCVDEIVTFTTESLDTLSEYKWNFGPYSDPEEAFTAGPHEVIYTRRGKKTGYLKVNHEGGSDAVFFEVNVQRLPEGNQLISEHLGFGEINLSTDVKYLDSIIWDFGDGNSFVGNIANYTYQTDGVYTVTMTGKSACDDVILTQEVGISTTTGTNDIYNSQIKVRPNPNNGDFAVDVPFNSTKNQNVELVSIEGRKLFSKTLESSTVNIIGIPSGMYFLHYTFDGYRLTKKVVVR